MSHTDSESSIRVTNPSAWPRAVPTRASAAKVFDTELFETFVARIVRKNLVSQYVSSDHQVYLDEVRLIGEAAERLQSHLAQSVPSWNLSWRISKMVIVRHIRKMAEERLDMHDVDDEAREEALEKVYQDDFEKLWPKDWLDS